MMNDISIAIAAQKESAELIDFLAQNGGEEWRYLAQEYVACMFSNDYRRPAFLVAKANDKIIGAVCYSEELFTAHVWGISWLNVHPDYRRQGIATRLIEACAAEIKSKTDKPVTLILNAYESAAGLYEKCGFTRGGLDAEGEPFMMKILS